MVCSKNKEAARPRLLVPKEAINPCFRPWLTAQQRTQLFYGGAGSGKSVFVATRVALDALQARNTLVVRRVERTIKTSAYNEVKKAIGRLGLSPHFKAHESDLVLHCLPTGAQIIFRGLDDAEKVKSITPLRGVLTDIWVEEATECGRADIKQLEKRLRGISDKRKRLTMTFNPVSRGHWLYRAYFHALREENLPYCDEQLLVVRTTYRDNAFLTDDDRAAYEREQDPYFRAVYTLGEWGLQAGGILTRFEEANLSGLPRPAGRLRVGLDFGYARDPAAYVLLLTDARQGTIYVLAGEYLYGLSNRALAQRLKPVAGGLPVVCDSAEPKSIAELRQHGLNALPARKGADSLRHGLRYLAAQRIVVDKGCVQVLEELRNYRWKQDKWGMALPVPQGEDHLMDAMRYALEQDSLGSAAAAR